MPKLRYLPNVTTLALDRDKCVGCGLCLEVCPHAVFRMAAQRAEIIDRDACMECGACQANCPAGAIHVEAGVGCAAAIINSALKGKDAPACCC